MKAGAGVVEVSRFEVYRHTPISSGPPTAACQAVLSAQKTPQVEEQTREQDPPLGLFYLHANLSSNVTVTCPVCCCCGGCIGNIGGGIGNIGADWGRACVRACVVD